MKEIWKDINDFSGYQISNIGNVKSLSKEVKTRWGVRISKEIILTSNIGYGGYRFQSIKNKVFSIHRLVAVYFIENVEGKNFVNHIDSDKTNNKIDNLEWVTQRENTHHYEKTQNRYSKYIGVSYDNNRKKWTSKIKIGGKTINLGRFEEEINAYNKYIEYAESKGLSSKYSK